MIDLVINKNVNFSTTLQYFGNIMLQISPNSNKLDIFELYTERAVENVQDGISRPPVVVDINEHIDQSNL